MAARRLVEAVTPITRRHEQPVAPSADDITPAYDLSAQSPPMQRLFARASRVAPGDTTILITGETGVGKERLARWLHAHSRRAGRHFLAVNCGAFPDTLLDTHLFGHARGAFTGAVHDAVGVFEAAHGGTLFLDEIGDVSPTMQVKLLRVLQERHVQRVGEWRLRRVDVRVIAATNRDLAVEMSQGRFRADLFYRVHGAGLHVPPLRERPDDVRLLTRELLRRVATRLHCPVDGYTPQAFACLLWYTWPGNVRELENTIEEACAVAAGPEIQLEDLPDRVRDRFVPARSSHVHGFSALRPLADLEQAYIAAVLKRNQGNRRRTAMELGISLSTLKRRLRQRPRRA